ncbi:RDD family protein [Flammeovirgaceae bacterium SG7u.111]|nr:RDD family protein [Flammeovirgaceae bacterium SG7u.132]WPO33342.1 RDD family protein [Flammeovirgaceae bacterium SG7u.111]
MTGSEQLLDYEPEVQKLEDASNGKRFVNYLIDVICVYAIAFAVGVFMAINGAIGGSEFSFYLVGWIVTIVFYSGLEGFLGGKTVGKYITKTRVVTEDGETPTFINIVGRSFCRLIPFDAFSFLGEKPGGWHDSISKTRVVLD